MLCRAFHLPNNMLSTLRALQWPDHGHVPLGHTEIYWTPRTTTYYLHWKCVKVPRGEQGAHLFMGISLSCQSTSSYCPVRHQFEILRSQDTLVGRMVRKDGSHHKNAHEKCWGCHKPRTKGWQALTSTTKPLWIRGPYLRTPRTHWHQIISSVLKDWNRTINVEKSHEGTPKGTETGRWLLETVGKGIPPRVKKLPWSLSAT
jgi:hypothetical protein